jgi:hypothetical protein
MLLEVPSAIETGTKVRVKVLASGIVSEGTVSHCEPYGPWFRLGLKFGKAVLMKETVPNLPKSLD